MLQITLTLTTAFAMAFLFSCSDDLERLERPDGTSSSSESSANIATGSSSSNVNSSSSEVNSSSSKISSSSGEVSSSGIACTPADNDYFNYCSNGTLKTYGGAPIGMKTYKTVVIGNQTWMAENVEYRGSSFSQDTLGQCYGNISDYCDTYGRLYTWAEAMDICPSGYRLPTNEDWEELINYIESENDCSNCAGKHLKATSGWNIDGSGLDTYGFAALPGGLAISDNYSDKAGFEGFWWNADLYNPDEGTMAYNAFMENDKDAVSFYRDYKSLLLSVRCVFGSAP